MQPPDRFGALWKARVTGGPFCLLIPTPLNRQFLRHGQGHHDYGSHHGRQADSRDDTGGRPNDQGGAAPLPALPRSPRAASAPPETQPGRLPRAGWPRREQGRRSGGEKLWCRLPALSRLPPAPADLPPHLSKWVLWTAVAPTARRPRCGAPPPGACGLFVRGHLRGHHPTPPFPCPAPPALASVGGEPIPGTLPAQHGAGAGVRRAAGDGTRRHPGKPAVRVQRRLAREAGRASAQAGFCPSAQDRMPHPALTLCCCPSPSKRAPHSCPFLCSFWACWALQAACRSWWRLPSRSTLPTTWQPLPAG